jgi:hypothetical protein|tara:strand:- start:771 stop:1130 length:360 start_codon:yes stop_codon:yes gene_type:complete
MTRSLTTDEHNCLADVVIDPAAWWAHAQAIAELRGSDAEASLAAKISKYEAGYSAVKNNGDYQTRAERDAAADADRTERETANLAVIAAAQAQKDTDFAAAVDAAVDAKLKAAGVMTDA